VQKQKLALMFQPSVLTDMMPVEDAFVQADNLGASSKRNVWPFQVVAPEMIVAETALASLLDLLGAQPPTLVLQFLLIARTITTTAEVARALSPVLLGVLLRKNA
jgi:hypothetical protein